MQPFTNIAEVFASIDSSFDRAAVGSQRAVIQFDLTGQAAARYWLSVDAGTCTYGTGDAPTPATVTICCTAEDLLTMLSDTLNPLTAYMRGRVKVKGDVRVAMSLKRWFPERR